MYSTATIKRARTILRNADTGTRTPSYTTTSKPAKAPVRRNVQPISDDFGTRLAQMHGKLATAGQMRRINAAYERQGLRTFDTIDEFRAVIGDMAAASVEWNRVR
jgi:hypothetical protein